LRLLEARHLTQRFLTVFSILPTGLLSTHESKTEDGRPLPPAVKANAIELKAKVAEDASGSDPGCGRCWIVLTDDEPEAGAVDIGMGCAGREGSRLLLSGRW